MGKKTTLSKSMTEAEFDNGYWYASELKEFAAKVGIPSANKLRKNELEKALKRFIRTGATKTFVKRVRAKPGARDVDAGLSLDLPIVTYTSNRQTKEFIERKAAKLEPKFKRSSGTRYLLNRWREAQLATGKRITFRDLVMQAIDLNKTKRGPLCVEHGRARGAAGVVVSVRTMRNSPARSKKQNDMGNSKSLLAALALLGLATPLAYAADGAGAGPSATWPIYSIAPPQDRTYGGDIQLSVDATDIARRVVRIHERVSGIGADTVLLYPKWLPGTHAPEGPIDKIAGIRIASGGTPVPWTRDPVDVYAIRVHTGAGVHTIDIDFEYLSPTSPKVGALEISRDVLMLEWNEVVLYPAGYFVRQIPVQASLTLPPDWQSASALETASASAGRTSYKPTNLETLIDSPVYAGRYAKIFDLDPGGSVPVRLDLFADRPEFLNVRPEQLAAYRALVQQAYKLYGSHHYAHYDFLYSLSDQIQFNGLEHHQSSEDGTDPEAFTKWDKSAYARDLLPHEFTHSWNGKFRRPADLWTPNYNVPMQDSLLWVYEGQTEYWGEVLSARSGLRTREQALDQLAYLAAFYERQPGRRWRALQDTTNDEIINPRRPQSWTNWQRFEDYYDEGVLIWLDADTLIRERSKGKRSLDDFARAFFGIRDGSFAVATFTFDDVVKALNAVEPYDWAAFLRQRLDSIGKPAPLDGLRRGGYKLVYTDTLGDFLAGSEEQRKRINLTFSIGVELDDKEKPMQGIVSEVIWDGPAFKAGITEGDQILAINGIAYDADVLKDAIRAAAADAKTPIELILKSGDRFKVARVDYHDGLRYPHLERDTSQPARLDDILAARP